MGRIRGTRRHNCRPAGVVATFQVTESSIEPAKSNRCRNLLSHDDSGPSGTNERKERRPKVSLVPQSCSAAGNREGLAGAAPSPEFSVIWPASQSSSEGPSSDAGKEVALGVAFEVIGTDINDAPFINITWCDMAGGNQVAKPLRGEWVNLVVVGCHFAPCPNGMVGRVMAAIKAALVRAALPGRRVVCGPGFGVVSLTSVSLVSVISLPFPR
jgi:hypothetical protein